jgi:DNA-binding MarR family transcriptional regulator
VPQLSDSTAPPDAPPAVIDAVLAASRVLVAVAARSIAAAGHDITVLQYRVLVVLASKGPARPVDLAEALAISSSATTRLCDRLSRKGLISRARESDTADRRAVRLGLTARGAALLDEVTSRRRAQIGRIVAAVPVRDRSRLVAAFAAFSAAAGEIPDAQWPVRWEI